MSLEEELEQPAEERDYWQQWRAQMMGQKLREKGQVGDEGMGHQQKLIKLWSTLEYSKVLKCLKLHRSPSLNYFRVLFFL